MGFIDSRILNILLIKIKLLDYKFKLLVSMAF